MNRGTKEVCLLRATFFGLTSDYMTDIYRIIFDMKMHGNWQFQEIYSLPIKLRNWYFEKLHKHFEERNKAMGEMSK